MTAKAYQLKKELKVPYNATVRIPDGWHQCGIRRSEINEFEFETVYANGISVMSESELLTSGLASWEVQIDNFRKLVFRAHNLSQPPHNHEHD